jgi:hypothetical protein
LVHAKREKIAMVDIALETGTAREQKAASGRRKISPDMVAWANDLLRLAAGESAAPRGFDGGHVYLPHAHHGVESPLGFATPGGKRVGQRARGDLP